MTLYVGRSMLLLHGDGADGSTTFADSGGGNLAVTPHGNAHISTAESKFGGASMQFDGSGDYLTIANSQVFNFGADDFTIECFIRPSSFSGDQAIVNMFTAWVSRLGFYLGVRAGSPNILIFRAGNGAAILLNGDTPLTAGEWTHIAVSRFAGTTKMFVNGVTQSATHTGTVLIASESVLGVGAATQLFDENYNGYIDALRITRGTAYYTSDFTPPNAPLLPITDTALLLHADGADGSTTFSDVTGKTVTAFGAAKISTAQSRFGGSSMYFDDSVNSYISTPYTSDFDFGNRDFTLEMWLYRTGANINGSRLWGAGDDYYHQIDLSVSAAGLLGCYGTTQTYLWTAWANGGIAPIPLNTWTHVAVVRAGGTVTAYVDGVGVTLTSTLGNTPLGIGSGANVVRTIGGQGGINRSFIGYIDDLRVSKGVAIYSANFTPPSAPLAPTSIRPGDSQISIQTPSPYAPPLSHYNPVVSKPVMQAKATDLRDRLPYGIPNTPAVNNLNPWEFKGRGRITGTVKNTPATPVSRLLRLYREPGGLLVKSIWSHPDTGAYTFDGLSIDYRYTVISFDHTQAFRAVIADRVIPEAIP